MTNFLSLIKVQLLSVLGSNKLKTKDKKAKAGFAGIALMLLIIGGAMVFFGYTYSKIFAMAFAQTGGDEKLIPLMIAISCLISFMFSFYMAGSALFGFKDYDMLMSMPLKPSEIVLSKFCVLYISDLFFALTIVLPSLFVYNGAIATITFAQVVCALAMIILSPLLPLTLSCVIGIVVYYISSKFRRKNIIQLILLMLIMVGVMAFSFMSGLDSEDPTQMLGTIEILEKVYFIFPWLVNAFLNPIWLLVFLAVNALPLAIVIIFICFFYKKLNTIFTAKRTLRNFKLKEYQTNGVNKTLFIKELKRLFSSPVYAMNSLIGIVMALVTSVAYAVINITLVKSEPMFIELFNILNVFVPAIFCFMFLLSPTTCCAISMEGQAFWIIKTAPVSYLKVLNSKLAVHTLFSTSVAFVCSLVIGIFAGFGIIGTVLLVVCAVAISCFGGVFGLFMNLRFPKLKWENENVPVKQGLPTFLTMIIAFVSVAIIVVMGIYVKLPLNAMLAIFSAIFVLLSVSLYIVLYKCGGKMFNKLN